MTAATTDSATTDTTADAAAAAAAPAVRAAPPPEVAQLLRLADLVTPMALRVAATLRLTDRMLEGCDTVPELAAAAGCAADGLARLLRHLAAVGVVAFDADGRVAPTELGRVLADAHPAGQRSWLDLDLAIGRADLGFARLLDAVRTNRAVHELVHGRDFWADLSADPALAASFDAVMGSGRAAVFEAVTGAYDWSSVGRVADVGGGTGGQLAALLGAEQGLRGTLLDLPGPVARARELLAAAGVSERCETVAGSFFDPLPFTADAILLSLVLHDWPDEDAVRILTRCRAALAPGGRILLVEKAVEAQRVEPGFSSMDLRMLVYLGGRERTAQEWTALAERAGLSVRSVSEPFGFGSSLLTLVPAG